LKYGTITVALRYHYGYLP